MFPRGWQDSALFAGALGSLQGQTDGQTSGSPFPWLTALPRPGAAPPRLKSASGPGGEQLRGLGARAQGCPSPLGGAGGPGDLGAPARGDQRRERAFCSPDGAFGTGADPPPVLPAPRSPPVPIPAAPDPPRPVPARLGVASPARGRAGTRLFVIFPEQILIKRNT